MRRGLASAPIWLALLVAVAAPSATAAPVRINQLQVVGTHNSYHVEPSPAEKALRSGSGLIDETMLEYSFAPLGWQLERQDVRQVELDVWADPQGGAYATPRLRALAGGGPYSPAMTRPGIKVLHVSGYTAGALRHSEALEDGAAFLPKPFTPKALIARLQEVMRRELKDA